MQLNVTVRGYDELLAKHARNVNDIPNALTQTITKLAIDLQRKVMLEKLSGDPLHRRTGDLSRSVDYHVEDMEATVGAHTPYAAYQEYGFTGTVSVAAHVRRSRQQMTAAIHNKLGYETRPSKARNAGTGDIYVSAHSRHIDYPAHSYLRSALTEMEDKIRLDITRAVERVLTS